MRDQKIKGRVVAGTGMVDPVRAAALPVRLSSQEMVDGILRSIRDQFYFAAPDRLFFQERAMLIRAITFPAQYLKLRGFEEEIPVARYREIVGAILTTIKRHGDMAGAHSPARYLFRAVQTHMQHHGDEYLDEAKRTRDAIDRVRLGISKLKTPPSPDRCVADLDQISKLVGGRGGRKKKQSPAALQGDLFGSCSPSAIPAHRP